MGPDPWYNIKAFCLALFTLSLAGIPTLALAQPQDELVWKSIPIPGSEYSIVYLFGTIATAEGVRRLYSSLGKYKNERSKEDGDMEPKKGISVRENLKWLIEKMKDVKEIDYKDIPGLIRQTTRITPNAPYNLTAYDREKLAKLCAILIDEFETLSHIHETHLGTLNETTEKLRDFMALPDEETLENMLQHTEELLKFAKGIKREFNTWFPEETNTTLDNVIKRMEEYFKQANQDADLVSTYQDRLNEIALEMNFPPTSWVRPFKDVLYDYLSPLGAVFETTPATLSPRTILLRIQDGIAAISQEIPDRYKEHDAQGTLLIPKSIAGLRKAVHRMTAGMSGVQGTGDQQTMTLRQIWNEIPAGMRPLGGNCPTDIDQFRTWLNTLARPYNPQPPAACNHPVELATELGDPITQDWNTSLTHVRQLVNRPAPPGGPPPPPRGVPPAAGTEHLFRTSDLPKFGDNDDYWTYRRAMTIFCQSVTVAPTQLAMAIARITSSFEGDRRKTVLAFDLSDVYQPTWEATWIALINYLDANFLPSKTWENQYNHWTGLRYSDKLWGREFVSLYIREVGTLNQIATVQNKRTIPVSEAVQKLMDRIPRNVARQVRHEHRNWDTTTNMRLVYDWIVEEWDHAKDMGFIQPKQAKEGSKPTVTPARNMSLPLNAPGRESPRIDWPNLVCDKPCFDTTPAISPALRGPWRDLPEDSKRGLHSRCRRPISEHGHGTKGCNQAGQHLFHKGTNANPVNPSRQITTGNNEDQETTVAPLSGNE